VAAAASAVASSLPLSPVENLPPPSSRQSSECLPRLSSRGRSRTHTVDSTQSADKRASPRNENVIRKRECACGQNVLM
jgi:hypothetical protein